MEKVGWMSCPGRGIGGRGEGERSVIDTIVTGDGRR
jgi:hypothetical protein